MKFAESALSPAAIGITFSREPSSRINSSTDATFAAFFSLVSEMLELILPIPSPSIPFMLEIKPPREPIEAEFSLTD